MKGKILLVLSLLIMAGLSILFMKSFFLDNSRQLIIPEGGLVFELPEKTFKNIESDGEPMRISLGQVNRKTAIIDLLLGESNIKKEEIKVGESLEFSFEKAIYTLSLISIDAKMIGEEVAHFKLTKKGSTKEHQVEKSVSEVLNIALKSDFEVRKNDKLFAKDRFTRRLKNKAKRSITFTEFMAKTDEHFTTYSIVENNKTYTVSEWLKSKR